MRLKATCSRIGVLTLIGWLPLSACAAHVEPKCSERAAPRDSKEAKANPEVAADPVSLILAQIPRHTSGQFETPERVLGFLFDKVASRDLIGSLAAFPVVEEYERVRLKDYHEHTGGFSPKNYPLDDAPYARLSYSLNSHLAQYRGISVRILTDDPGGVRSLKPGSDATDLVRDLDGKRLKALRVTSIEEVRPEDRPKLTPIDRALGVTEKRLFSTIITLDERTIELTGFVGRIAGDWRVLSVLLSP